jgi:DNA polymerase-4
MECETTEPERSDRAVIIHVDMDAFFASVEQRDDPALRGKPVVVGGTPEARGVVAAASYEARPYGVRSAMPMAEALRLCPHVIRRPGRYDVYRQVAAQIRTILQQYSPLVEPLSLDEAFLDVAGCEESLGTAETIGRAIKRQILETCHLVASVGIGPVKFIAKLASDHGKPDGFVMIPEDQVLDFLAPLPVERLWGVGKATARRLHELRVRTIADLRRFPRDLLAHHFGSQGPHLWDLSHGIDPRPVDPGGDPKSISHESTFAKDITDPDQLLAELHDLTDRVSVRLRKGGLRAKGISIKIRFSDFRTISRSAHHPTGLSGSAECWHEVRDLWTREESLRHVPIRLLGVAAHHIVPAGERQLDLFEQGMKDSERAVDAAIDEIRQRFGMGALLSADRLKAATDSPAMPNVRPRNSPLGPEKQ